MGYGSSPTIHTNHAMKTCIGFLLFAMTEQTIIQITTKMRTIKIELHTTDG
jgi:hypothetical protein